MFSWSLEAQTHAKVLPEQVWDAWVDVSSWPQWDLCTKSCVLDEAFANGLCGKRRSVGAWNARFTILSAEPAKRFSLKTRLFGAQVIHNYYVAPWWDEKVRIVQQIEVSGFFSPIAWLFLGRKWKRRLPESMKRFSSFLESKGN